MNTQVISKNLVRLRMSQNWTQEDLSDKLHISRQAISKWETGISMPNLDTLLELSKLYKISINEIIDPLICKLISDFEEIINLEPSKLQRVLASFTVSEIVKASMGASPDINKLLINLFPNIDFTKERAAIGSVRITEIENIHNRIINSINSEGEGTVT